MRIEWVSSKCGRDFDEYVARTLGSWAPATVPETRTLMNLWQGRHCKICLSDQQGWHQGKVRSMTQSVDRQDTYSKWSLELEILQDDAAEPDLKRRKVVNSAGKAGSEGRTGTTRKEERTKTVMTFLVNRMNIEGGGTLKSDSDESSTELISLEWMQPAQPAPDLYQGVLSYNCPYCRAIEPMVAAHEDPTLERNDECPVCLETCDCRVLQCGHTICHLCWGSCRRSTVLSLVDVDELDAEQIASERRERYRYFESCDGGQQAFEERLKERAAAFAAVANEITSEKEGLTRFYRELMVEKPAVWMHRDLYVHYEKMPVVRKKILFQALEERKVEYLGSGLGEQRASLERSFHSLGTRIVYWIVLSYLEETALVRLAVPWLKLASYHEKRCNPDGSKEHVRVLGELQFKYGQLTQALQSFEECLSFRSDDEVARQNREAVLREMKEWMGTSGKLPPGC